MNPLFHETDDLLSKLRLSGVCQEHGDTMTIVEGCFGSARLEMRRAFGALKVNSSISITPTDDPQTDQQYTRLAFENLEEALVERCLCYKLRSGWLDSSADDGGRFDSEALFREWDMGSLEDRCAMLDRTIDDLMSEIGVQDSYSRTGSFGALVIGPEGSPPLVSGLIHDEEGDC